MSVAFLVRDAAAEQGKQVTNLPTKEAVRLAGDQPATVFSY